MTDPFSVSVGVAGLISLGIQVAGSLIQYYTVYKDRDTVVARTTRKLETLLGTFQSLDDVLGNRELCAGGAAQIRQVEDIIKQCDELIRELQNIHSKLQDPSAGAIRAIRHHIAYPLKKSTLQKLDEDTSDLLQILSLALDVIQLRDSKAVQDEIAEAKSLLELVRATQVSDQLRDWLKAPEASSDHNEAVAKRHPNTGMWLVKGQAFDDWLNLGNSFLWLNGFAGSGKTVLCSTSIQYAFRQKRGSEDVGIAMFYFKFDDEGKRDENAMLRALLLQLSSQLRDGNTVLDRLRNRSQSGAPSTPALLDSLQDMVQRFRQVHILLDALDEATRSKQRDRVLSAVKTIRSWSTPGLHLLVTSRDEPDIRESLNTAQSEEIVMKNDGIDKDICLYTAGQLQTNPKLDKWRGEHDRILQALSKRANGVFRWVECQFETLERCRSLRHLDVCLDSLPRTLDDTYVRMLCNIDEDSIEEARRILALLCYSARPMTVRELIDALAVDLAGSTGFDPRSRLLDANGLHEICPGLIEFSTNSQTSGDEEQECTVHIAHFSVQEYLQSPRIRKQKAAIYALSDASTHAEIAKLCCTYLLEPGLSKITDRATRLEKFPFARFAAEFWFHHYSHAKGAVDQINNLVLDVFRQRYGAFRTWITLHEIDYPSRAIDRTRWQRQIASPIYYASFLGLEWVLDDLLLRERSNRDEIKRLVNIYDGYYGNALQAAAIGGHEALIQKLIDAGADVNARGGRSGSALQLAANHGQEAVVQRLLDAGANVNAQSERFGSALQAAAIHGNEAVVQRLLDAGADINAQGERFGSALQVAANYGQEAVVQKLLDAGADVNAQKGLWGGALFTAARCNHEIVVQRLLDAGADVNAQDELLGNALHAAAQNNNEAVVQKLLDAKADVNAQGGVYGSALQAAASGGYKELVQKLLDAKADVNAQGGLYGSAIYAALRNGHREVVQKLLDAGADINAEGERFGSALEAAASGGNKALVQKLLHAGARAR